MRVEWRSNFVVGELIEFLASSRPSITLDFNKVITLLMEKISARGIRIVGTGMPIKRGVAQGRVSF
jgi:hypothetical protein